MGADMVCTSPQNRHSGPRWPALPCVGAWLVRLPSMALAAVVRMLLIARGCAILRKQRQNPLPGFASRSAKKRTTRARVFFLCGSVTPKQWWAGRGPFGAPGFPFVRRYANLALLVTPCYGGLGGSSLGGAGFLFCPVMRIPSSSPPVRFASPVVIHLQKGITP